MKIKNKIIQSADSNSARELELINNEITKEFSLIKNNNLCCISDDKYPKIMNFLYDKELNHQIYDSDEIYVIFNSYDLQRGVNVKTYVFINEESSHVLDIEDISFINKNGEKETRNNVVYILDEVCCGYKRYLKLSVDHLNKFLCENNININQVCGNSILNYLRIKKIERIKSSMNR